ncbi:transcriptional regulator [Acholeplasma laidlawii]|uniref:Uncharacterized protein n=1 Tax=Acholeplasma laidlawii (strain PG-8A) TaxID=441768 RepID=A9NH10_ACHLI|nr:transcriptional regulator [Acholeplasma laidlawii]ABX81640.1 hypothetical protein ACL_1030 [Acholeplasma laidlawii PG-8A]NWH09786.1 transcriptional regulator [Acholeplasma laidlawii]OED27226.1 hypothetical protein A9269_05255 [Acholeplasma laidlawii]OED28670.1 hypothetical protein A9268_04615 [Acholeplasma laidlawii]OWU87100.1 hypothetical protein A8G01_06190 [Acholeplasma laidlawii]
MEKYGSYYKLLDELRIAKGYTIADLCEGIISERTYLRQIKNGSKVNFTIFSRLLDRLDTGMGQFMTYMIHFDKSDTGVNRFAIRVHMYHFMDIGPIYELILKYKSDNKIETLMVEAFKLEFEYLINKITKDEFKIHYQVILESLKSLGTENLIVHLIKFIYHSYFKEDNIIDPKKFGQMLIDYNSNLSLFFYIMLMDKFLSFMTQQETIDFDIYEQILKKFEAYFIYINVKNYETSLETYHAFLYHVKHDYKMRDSYLYKALMNSLVIHSTYAHEAYKDLIRHGFNLDVDQFLIDYTLSIESSLLR